MNNKTYVKQVLTIILVSTLLLGCAGSNTQTNGPQTPNNTQDAAIIGAFLGALAGVMSKGNNKGKRMVIGGAIGAAIGGGIGYSMDQQAKEIAKELEVEVDNSRDAALNHDSDLIISNTDSYVKITIRDAMIFKTNSSIPTQSAARKIDKIANVLQRYPNTLVQVVGFTDNAGTYEYNQELSEKRASNVGDIIYNSGIKNKVYSKGCSYYNPLIVNTSKENMALNRRVEIYLYSNEESIRNVCTK